MRIFLNEEDCPNAGDRDAAERIIREIALNDVVTKGSFVIEGYSAARRVARALTAARADERRRGLDTPFRMREIVPAKGAEAVTVRWPTLSPLHHWTTIEGVQFQSYKSPYRDLLISDDARFILKRMSEVWQISLDGQEVLGGTFQRSFATAEDAVRQALSRRREKEK